MKTQKGTTVDVNLNIPKWELIFKASECSEGQMVATLVSFCGFNKRTALGRTKQVFDEGEASVYTATKEIVNDIFKMCEAFSVINHFELNMDIREAI